MKWKRQHIGWDVFPSVGPVNALHPLVVHTDDPQVEFPDPQDASQRLHLAAERRPPERDGSLQVPEHQTHGGASRASAKEPAVEVWKDVSKESDDKFCKNTHAHTVKSFYLVQLHWKIYGRPHFAIRKI